MTAVSSTGTLGHNVDKRSDKFKGMKYMWYFFIRV